MTTGSVSQRAATCFYLSTSSMRALLLALLGLVAFAAVQAGRTSSAGSVSHELNSRHRGLCRLSCLWDSLPKLDHNTAKSSACNSRHNGFRLFDPSNKVRFHPPRGAQLCSFNMFVHHPQKTDLTGAFCYGLYADAGGVPAGSPLATIRATRLPYTNGPSSAIAKDALNATYQTIAITGAAVQLNAGAYYWVCITSNNKLEIFADISGALMFYSLLPRARRLTVCLQAGRGSCLRPLRPLRIHTQISPIVNLRTSSSRAARSCLRTSNCSSL